MPVEEAPKEKRIKRIRSRVSRLGIDALLVTSQSDIIYLFGFYTHGAVLLVPKGEKPVYFVDQMNGTLAEKALKGRKLQVVMQGETFTGAISKFASARRIKRIGYDPDTLTVSAYYGLLRSMPKVKFFPEIKKIPVGSIIRDLRKAKESNEIRILRKAAKATVRIWEEIKKSIKPGMNERQIASLVDVRVRESGYENSFPTIAASGKNTAYPHAVPMGRNLKKGEHLLLDFGIRHKGYCSDLTRIWADGRIGRKIELLQKHVCLVQDKVIRKLKSGVGIGALTKEAHLYFKNNNLGDYICHGLGHGIGLDVHEVPFLGESSTGRLKEGMVVTIEPDMVLITKNGCEVLTR